MKIIEKQLNKQQIDYIELKLSTASIFYSFAMPADIVITLRMKLRRNASWKTK